MVVRLDLHPTAEQAGVAGRHLIRLSQRRRAGAAGPFADDAWCLESLPMGGGRSAPRLRWARSRPEDGPKTPAHLALAFDLFHATVANRAPGDGKLPLLAYGLTAHLVREFSFADGQPVWRLRVASDYDGLKLPDGVVTNRLVKLHAAVLAGTARNLHPEGKWPEIVTRPDEENLETLTRLHALCDWVVTMDRNAGIEYFDSPREAQAVFDSYVIDAVPERDDLGCLQLITSTTHFDEVRRILDGALGQMGLSSSRRNCAFLLGHLKGMSGRLAMRLAACVGQSAAERVGAELIALSLVRKKCLDALENDGCWLSLQRGFFIPLDDVRDLLPSAAADNKDDETEPEREATRADLLYVSIPAARGERLALRFVEVKYRRHLSLARSGGLSDSIAQQTEKTRERWTRPFFDGGLSGSERVMRAARLGRVLRFYADKALRHHADDATRARFVATHERFVDELHLFLRDPVKYELAQKEGADRGYVFCPDYTNPRAERLRSGSGDQCEIWLFGPDTLPDRPAFMTPPTSSLPEPPASDVGEEMAAAPLVAAADHPAATEDDPALPAISGLGDVTLGQSGTGQPVRWLPSIQGNPHLMILGLPGMGKTTCLINLCRQLQARGIVPIVFSYHDDIDEKILAEFPGAGQQDCTNLGFNPMQVMQPGPRAHIESAGQLRDIFHAIFPDLGDLQLEQIRSAIKESYAEAGWNGVDAPDAPPFRRFVERLREKGGADKRTQTLLARLNELDDFGFFGSESGAVSVMEAAQPQLIRIHSVSNEAVQRAYAGFMLYRIYQDMFHRGRPDRITHAIVFDEAHRAGKLKLLPTMAKECRKYGLSLIVASQEARDFDAGLFSAIANYLVLRVTDQDAKVMARNVAPSDKEKSIVDRLKNLPKYEALLFSESQSRPVAVRLGAG